MMKEQFPIPYHIPWAAPWWALELWITKYCHAVDMITDLDSFPQSQQKANYSCVILDQT